MVLAVFSYRYDAELVPDLLANIAPAVDGWVAFNDRDATDVFSSESQRRRLLIERARELGAAWVLAIDPDERIERGAATRIRALTREWRRIVWEFNLREMFTPTAYRVDGIWGSKMLGRLFPVFDGPLCSEQALHGSWCVPRAGYSVFPAGLNLYHLKMMSSRRRQARRDLYRHLDPANRFQAVGYDYLTDEAGAEFEQIPPGRDFVPAYMDAPDSKQYMADLISKPNEVRPIRALEDESYRASSSCPNLYSGETVMSQMGQLRISYGEKLTHDSKIAVVVIGLRAPKFLFDAVRSLIGQDVVPEIVVVNSGGGDAAAVLGDQRSAVTLVEISEPVFVGAARNLGIQVSRAPFVAFLAADCIAAPGWVAERLRAHMEGHSAVGCVVENDKTGNPFAWAAHLMTYGHRMTASSYEGQAYGASYDRALFDKYGYFSETMTIGEDSEFHSRFKQSDFVSLHPGIRTIHGNPCGPISFLADQWRRGMRAHLMAEFLRANFTLHYMVKGAASRVLSSIYLSATCLKKRERLRAIMSWPMLPIGALSYLIGMAVSYMKINAAERCYRQATAQALLGQRAAAIRQLRRAISLRPITAHYHLALAVLLNGAGEDDQRARQLYTSWDIDRGSLIELYHSSIGDSRPANSTIQTSIRFQVVVFSDRSDVELAQFLNAISAQIANVERLDVLVIEASGGSFASPAGQQLRKSRECFARFVLPEEALTTWGADRTDTDCCTSFVVVSSCSYLPPPDWLSALAAYIVTYPEIELFDGNFSPLQGRPANFVESLSLELGLFPRAGSNGRASHCSHVAHWACRKSLLTASGGLVHDRTKLLDSRTLRERVMKAGASRLYAPDWQIRFRVDATLTSLLWTAYTDGFYAVTDMAITQDRERAAQVFRGRGVRGSIAAAWRFTLVNYKGWWNSNRTLFQHLPAFLLLMSISRQNGWLAGLRRRSAARFIRSNKRRRH
jgi:glycosyltransferase involved in cell wall biosynthesis